MPQKAFFIGPYNAGMVNAVTPWMIPEEAFESMDNAYVWRGMVKKRVGSRLFPDDNGVEYDQLSSRLRVALETAGVSVVTDGAGAATGTVPGATFGIGQMFSIGTALYTVHQAGAPATMLITDGTTTATYNTTTGAYAFNGAPALTQVYWYPSTPVMGFALYETTSINDDLTFAFDQQFAYQRAGGTWERMAAEAVPGDALWSGSDSQFFWSTNYRGVTNDDYWLFVVNNNRADQIRYWDGAQWASIAPATRVAANYTLQTSRLIVYFKDRLIALNTWEEVGGAGVYLNFQNRARWSQNGSPIAANAWYDNVPGLGGWLEAPTKEAIITARILKDRLIVYFENSTWELVYTGNQVLPFVWQAIDKELGAESTFSSVLLDKIVLGVGESGIHSSDGLLVKRIDDKIPQSVFRINNDEEGLERVAGIRDFFLEMAYWSYNYAGKATEKYPNRMLVYNYKNESWSFNDDSITAFGYYRNVDDAIWSKTYTSWEETTRTWNSAIADAKFRNVLAGNQEGFTFILDGDIASNSPALQITDIDFTNSPILEMSVINHNLVANEFVLIEDSLGTTSLNNLIGRVYEVIDENTIEVSIEDGSIPAGTYTGRGTLARVSRIDLRTKQYNFYKEGTRFSINKVDFDVDRTEDNVLTTTFFSSSSPYDIGSDAVADGVALGTYNLDTFPYDTIYPLEATQDRLVHPVYLQAEGDCIQIRLYQDDDQIMNPDFVNQDFVLHSMTFYARSTGQRL